MMEVRNDDDDFLDFDAIEDKKDDNDVDNVIALGLTLNQALSEDNIPLARDIILEIVKKVEDENKEDNI